MNGDGLDRFDPSPPEPDPWQTEASRPLYGNPWIDVREDRVIRPDGTPGIYGVVHFRHRAVGILALDDEDRVVLVGQWRYPFGAYSWEIPEGGAAMDEDLLDAARRELAEETGLRARSWEWAGVAHLSNSVSDEVATWFRATGLEEGARDPDGTERIAVRRVPFRLALELARRGVITDAISVMALEREAALRAGSG